MSSLDIDRRIVRQTRYNLLTSIVALLGGLVIIGIELGSLWVVIGILLIMYGWYLGYSTFIVTYIHDVNNRLLYDLDRILTKELGPPSREKNDG